MSDLISTDLIRAILITSLVCLAYIDLRTFRLPDALTLPLVIFGFCFNALAIEPFASIQDSIFGAILGFALLWLTNYFYQLAKKQDGIGMGDAKLLAALGAWLGWQAIPGLLLIASLSGVLGGLLWLYWHEKGYQRAFPFGPFLVFAGIIELLWPQFLQTLLLSNLI
jgi:leader peptidase (prepilin peptidase)/N-methyltransferase